MKAKDDTRPDEPADENISSTPPNAFDREEGNLDPGVTNNTPDRVEREKKPADEKEREQSGA